MTLAYILVKGGLGNQMFQAALGVVLHRRFGVEIRYVTDYFDTDSYNRRFQLDAFPELLGDATSIEPAVGSPLIDEALFDSADLGAIFEEHQRAAFDGHWQNERFFFGENEAIKAAFRLDMPAEMVAQGDALRSASAIGIHVRRHDYGHHGHASLDYYRNAIAEIRREHGDLPVACFTDEPNFCAFAFRDIPGLTVFKSSVDDPLADFYLLSRCAHFIIANSSFSWWAAWLGETESSRVYAPSPWCDFDRSFAPIPPRWRKVENAVRGLG
jgi:hypothetical protein